MRAKRRILPLCHCHITIERWLLNDTILTRAICDTLLTVINHVSQNQSPRGRHPIFQDHCARKTHNHHMSLICSSHAIFGLLSSRITSPSPLNHFPSSKSPLAFDRYIYSEAEMCALSARTFGQVSVLFLSTTPTTTNDFRSLKRYRED